MHADKTPRTPTSQPGEGRLTRVQASAVAAAVGVAAVVTVQATLNLGTGSASASPAAQTAPLDPEVVLPSRVASALERTLDAVDRGSAAADDRRWSAARRSLNAAARDFTRANRAGLRQLQAQPAGEGEESTAGPDSVLAVLTVDQDSVARLSGLYDGVTGPKVIAAVTRALSTAQVRRASMLAAVIALPGEAGAPYVDALVDAVPLYADEVAGLTEALADDNLTHASRSALRSALTRSKHAETMVTAAFGGGED